MLKNDLSLSGGIWNDAHPCLPFTSNSLLIIPDSPTRIALVFSLSIFEQMQVKFFELNDACDQTIVQTNETTLLTTKCYL